MHSYQERKVRQMFLMANWLSTIWSSLLTKAVAATNCLCPITEIFQGCVIMGNNIFHLFYLRLYENVWEEAKERMRRGIKRLMPRPKGSPYTYTYTYVYTVYMCVCVCFHSEVICRSLQFIGPMYVCVCLSVHTREISTVSYKASTNN